MKIGGIKLSAGLGEIFSPRGLVIRAVVLLLVFAVMHLAGLRRMTTILCGTFEGIGRSKELTALLGFTYILFYVAATVIAPIMLIAAGILAAIHQSSPGRPPPSRTTSP